MNWFISVSPEDTSKPLDMDKMAESDTLKIQSWLNSIKSHVQTLEATPEKQIVLAVTDFDNTTGQTKHDWLRAGIPNFMSGYFSQIHGIKPVTRAAIENALLNDSSLKHIKAIGEDAAPEVGKQVGAEYIIIGSYQTYDEEATVNARILKTDTGKVLRAEQETGKLSDIDSLVGTLVFRIAGVIGTTVTDAEKQSIKEQGIQMMKVIEGLSKGELSRYVGDLDSARKYYEEALANDPTNEVVLERIKDIDAELKSIAIVDFKNNSKNPGFGYLSYAIPEELTTFMIHKTALPFTERLNLEKAKEELRLGQSDIIDDKTAPEVGKLAGATHLVIGSFSVVDEKITINTRLIDTETAGIIGSENADGLLENRQALEETLVDQLIRRLKEVRPVELREVVTDIEAHEAVKKAKQALQNVKNMDAKEHAPERLNEIEKLISQAEKALEKEGYDDARKIAYEVEQKSKGLMAALVRRGKAEDDKLEGFKKCLTKEEKLVELSLGESSVGFEYDSDKLKESSLPILSKVAGILKECSDYRVVIVGRTDSKGSDAYNQKLSERRAQSVLNYMTSQGVNSERMAIIGYGEKYPVEDNTTPEGRKENRRVEFRLIR
ncbi:MAG: OmpA family protein [bacterium]|nr:OmpA family protein [bacterium]